MKLINLSLRSVVLLAILACSAGAFLAPACGATEVVLFSFERDPDGWEIPDWAFEKDDHVAERIAISEWQASEGRYALEVEVNFTGVSHWQGAYIERVTDITEWSPFNYLSLDVYLPKGAPRGLRSRVILTVGESWAWAESNKTVPLTPGEWTVIKIDITPESRNWRKFIDSSFRSDVRKIGIRVESNGKITYKGPIYIDNIKLSN